MSNNKDFKVKNGIQPTVYHEGLGTVVSGSEGYSLASASYDSKSFSVASQEGAPSGITFKPDGTSFFMCGTSTADSVFEYSMTTAWDISTASYASKTFSFASQDTFPMGLQFKSDGTKMYMTGLLNESVFQYTLSTAWDVSTASYDSVSFSAGSIGVRDLFFKPDGTKMYIIHSGGDDSVRQYTLSTSWDLSTASYDSKSLIVSGQETTAAEAVSFSDDGTKVFIIGQGLDTVFQYNLTTAWDVSTGSYSGVSFSASSQQAAGTGLSFGDSGSKMYVVGQNPASVHQYSTVLNTAQLDLSTGSVFDYTPTSDVQVTLSNPAASGTVSGATLLLSGEEATGVGSTFSTTLYAGNAGTQTITNGIDLAGDGGLVWLKNREASSGDHWLFDTQRGAGYGLISHSTNAQTSFNNASLTSFNSNGFSVGDFAGVNTLNDFVSWAFKKQSSFFDVVTYTGNGVAGRSISHSLNSDVGTILFKRTDSASNWIVWHRSAGGAYGFLDASDAFTADSGISNPTTTTFTIESTINAGWNASGGTYVAYLFAHDTDASSLIKCGSYTGTGSAGNAVTLGWEPQWLIIKRTDAAQQWPIVDSVRGMSETGQVKQLRANNSFSESTVNDKTSPSATGFTLNDGDAEWNGSGGTYIYIAIRAESIPTITYDTAIEWPGGTAPTAPANGETDVVTFNTRDGGSTYQGVLAIDGAK